MAYGALWSDLINANQPSTISPPPSTPAIWKVRTGDDKDVCGVAKPEVFTR